MVEDHKSLIDFLNRCRPVRIGSVDFRNRELSQSEGRFIAAAVEAWWLIQQLRQPEGAELTLVCDNPDFNSQPDARIEICDDWTSWVTRTFTGSNVLECLRGALQARSEPRK